MTNITLSAEQEAAFDCFMRWYNGSGKTFTIAGYAGTGKSTLARLIADAIDPKNTAFAAYTGKAANVLREKGCANAGTLHSWLYSITDHNREIIGQLEAQIEEAHAAGNFAVVDALVTTLEQKRLAFRKPKFELNTESDLAHAPLIIVDEYSMLPKKLIEDLEAIGRKILYLGDPFQLPPIEGECTIEPTIFLEEIHRQALESPIIRASIAVRKGDALQHCDEPGFKYQPVAAIAPEEYSLVEQIIVGRNNTRQAWNKRFRENRGLDPHVADKRLPQAGDKMICLKNNPENGLYNGMIGFAMSDARFSGGDNYMLDFESDDKRKRGLPVWIGDVIGESQKYDGYNKRHRELQRFDYGYAITCHKSQGSEFDSVLVYNEPIGAGVERRRWLYTALTRAKNRCTLVDPRR